MKISVINSTGVHFYYCNGGGSKPTNYLFSIRTAIKVICSNSLNFHLKTIFKLYTKHLLQIFKYVGLSSRCEIMFIKGWKKTPVITEVGQEGGLWNTQIYQRFTIGKGLQNKHVIMVNIILFALWIGYLTGHIANWDKLGLSGLHCK